MDSESHPVENHEVKEKKRRGVDVFGYNVPYWAIIVVLLVLLYFAYERGYLAGVLGESQKTVEVVKQIELKGPVAQLEVTSAPEQVKKLFSGVRY